MPENNKRDCTSALNDMAMLLTSDNPPGFSDEINAANSVFEMGIYETLNGAEDVPDLGERIQGIVTNMGFSDFTFTIPELALEDGIHLLTTPPELRQAYKSGGFFEYDMITKYAKTGTAPIYDSVVDEYVTNAPFENEIILQNRELFRMLKSFGYYDFYVVPMRSGFRNGNVSFSVECKDEGPIALRRKVEKSKRIIHLLCGAIDHTLSTKFRDIFFMDKELEEIVVGPRPLQLLATLATDDLSLSEAADKLCISIHTANQHIASARKAFSARTTAGAVYKAAKLGLITL